MNQLLYIVFFVVLTINPGINKAQSFMTNVEGRKMISLNGKWQTILDWYNRGEQRNIQLDTLPKSKNSFNEYSFSNQTLNVPGDWNSQRLNLEYYEGAIWYKKEFNYQPTAHKRTFIHFGAVNHTAYVYLNGQLLGIHEGGFTPFQFEVTDKITANVNKLIVKVDNKRIADGIPALNFDWWNYGGITRDVSLITTPLSYIDDYFIQLKKGSLNIIKGWIKLKGNNGKEEITISIPDVNIQKTFRTNEEGYCSFEFDAKLKLWSPDDPILYQVGIRSSSDEIKEKIGFRSIAVKDEDVLLNGKPIFLKGVSIHEEIAQRKGRAASKEDALRLLLQAKELGCNFIRTTHYPQNEHLIRKAEEMGFMLWEEIPIWQGIDFKNPVLLDKARAMLRDMIARDKNRCAVIIWSLSNETRSSPERDSVLSELATFSRKMDPTRLISSAFNHFKYEGNKIIIDDPLSKDLDVLAANKYMGWYDPWPAGSGNIKWEINNKKPLIISEFGAEALYGNHGSADTASLWTEEFQEKVMKDNIKMFITNPQLSGICPWILIDFRSPTRMHAIYQNGWNRKGLLSDQGEKKKAWYIINDFYKNYP